MTTEFANFMQVERERIAARVEVLNVEARTIADELARLAREKNAIDIYERARRGEVDAAGVVIRTAARGERRARRGSRRQGLIDLLQRLGKPATRGELLDALGVKGDKQGEMSVSNALTALIKSGVLARDGGKYVMGPAAGHYEP